MDDIFREFQTNIQHIQNDLFQNFSMLNTNITPYDGFKLDWLGDLEVTGDVSVMFNSFQTELNSNFPSMNEAMELEKALRESLNRSMESAFAHVIDPCVHTPRSCYSLGDLYKVSKTSTTEMQRRLDDFYISCKRRRMENQHTMLEEMEKSLSKTREKAVSRCMKTNESSGHSSKTRVRRLTLPQRTKVPKDIDSVMGGVLNELENFLSEASEKKSMPKPGSPIRSKACRGLEAALGTFFIDVSSGKTSQVLNSTSVIHDEFSTSTDEVQEAYYSCQFPILDFPPDLMSVSNSSETKSELNEKDDDDDKDKGDGGGKEEDGGGTDEGKEPPPSPSPSGDDDFLSDIEVIEELENLPGDQCESSFNVEPTIDMMTGGPQIFMEGSNLTSITPDCPQPLSITRTSPHVAVMNHDTPHPTHPTHDVNQTVLIVPSSSHVTDKTESQSRETFESGNTQSCDNGFTPESGDTTRSVEEMDLGDTVPEESMSANIIPQRDISIADHAQSLLDEVASLCCQKEDAISADVSQDGGAESNLVNMKTDDLKETPWTRSADADKSDPSTDVIDLSADEDDDDIEIVYESFSADNNKKDDEDNGCGKPKESPQRRNIFEVLSQSASTPQSNVDTVLKVEIEQSCSITQDVEMQFVEEINQSEEENKVSVTSRKEERLVRNEMDADEVAAAVSSILPAVTPSEPPLCMSPLRIGSPSEHLTPTTPAPPTPSSLGSICPANHETLLQQLISVLDKMVEMYESSEGGRGRGSCPPSRLQAMLRESFSMVLGNRQTSIPSISGLDRSGADFQSHVSAALTSFLMSPASEAGPTPSSGSSERVAGWDLAGSGDSAPALGEEFCVNMDGFDRPENDEDMERDKEHSSERDSDERHPITASASMERTPATPYAKDDCNPNRAVISRIPSVSTVKPSSCEVTNQLENDTGVQTAISRLTDEDDELLDELFGSPSGDEISRTDPQSSTEHKGAWSGHYVYFFRKHENVSVKEAESLLLRAGASVFDPYHPHLVPKTSRLSVLIHSADVGRTHHIPNLLQLKNVRRTRFLLFSDPVSCSPDHGSVLFPPAASCIVLDAEVVISTHPDNLESLVIFLKEECLSQRPYRLVLHSQLRQLLPDLKMSCRDRYELFRLDKTIQLLNSPRYEGLIEWCGEARPSTRPDALLFMLKVQLERQKSFRDFFLLSNLDPQGLKAHVFARSGIATMSLYEFIINYTTKPFNSCSGGPGQIPESCADMMQDDAPLSWSIDVLPAFNSSVA